MAQWIKVGPPDAFQDIIISLLWIYDYFSSSPDPKNFKQFKRASTFAVFTDLSRPFWFYFWPFRTSPRYNKVFSDLQAVRGELSSCLNVTETASVSLFFANGHGDTYLTTKFYETVHTIFLSKPPLLAIQNMYTNLMPFIDINHQTSSISCTKSQNFHVCHLVLQFSA